LPPSAVVEFDMHFLVAAIFMVLSFVGTSVALAQSNGELVDLARPVLDALLGGNYMAAGMLALVLGVALLRRFGGSRWPILSSRKAAPYLVAAGALSASLAAAVVAGTALSFGLVWKLAAGAGFGYAMLKPLLGKIPYLGALFSSKSRAEEAHAAGIASVLAKPAKGTELDFEDIS
jgi:hypothetical protein